VAVPSRWQRGLVRCRHYYRSGSPCLVRRSPPPTSCFFLFFTEGLLPSLVACLFDLIERAQALHLIARRSLFSWSNRFAHTHSLLTPPFKPLLPRPAFKTPYTLWCSYPLPKVPLPPHTPHPPPPHTHTTLEPPQAPRLHRSPQTLNYLA